MEWKKIIKVKFTQIILCKYRAVTDKLRWFSDAQEIICFCFVSDLATWWGCENWQSRRTCWACGHVRDEQTRAKCADTCKMCRQTRARCADKHVLGVQMSLVFVHHNLFFHKEKRRILSNFNLQFVIFKTRILKKKNPFLLRTCENPCSWTF